MIVARVIVGLVVWGSAGTAWAESYPARQIEIVVPFPPGGTSDLSVRFLADKWKEFLGQPIVIVNKPGAGSAIGARFVANSKPDGYTLLIASETSLLSVPHMQPEAGYTKDSFTYLFAYSKGAVVFASRADASWKTLPQLVSAARAAPQKLTYSSYGVGTMGHFTAELLWKELGVAVRHIPYKSSPEANSAMLGGHTDLSVPSIIGSIEQNADVRVLAISAESRMPYAPRIPTLVELGYKTSLSYMNILVGPKGLPAEVIQKLSEAQSTAYSKYKAEIDAGMAKLELASMLLPGNEVVGIIAQRDAWYRELAPQLKTRN